MVKLTTNNPEKVTYQAYVDEYRAYGRNIKIERELRQND